MLDLVEKIEQWAHDRNLVEGSDAKTQLLKTMEELGELAKAVGKNDKPQIVDGIGDVIVTLVIVALQCGTSVPEATAAAYEEIKDRKGRMVNGLFQKEAA